MRSPRLYHSRHHTHLFVVSVCTDQLRREPHTDVVWINAVTTFRARHLYSLFHDLTHDLVKSLLESHHGTVLASSLDKEPTPLHHLLLRSVVSSSLGKRCEINPGNSNLKLGGVLSKAKRGTDLKHVKASNI